MITFGVYNYMQKLSTIILFYKPYILWSFAINLLITIFNPEVITAIGTKFFLVFFLWYYISHSKGKRLLNFYNNLGVSTLKLFISVFVMDITTTIGYLLIIKEFI